MTLVAVHLPDPGFHFKEQLLNHANNGFLEAACRCLQMLLRLDPYRCGDEDDEG
jgi:hypothetical protein